MFELLKNTTEVLVFKTNIGADDKERILTLLQAQNFVKEASIDLEDCDRVLRIVGDDVTTNRIIDLITEEGFICEELI